MMQKNNKITCLYFYLCWAGGKINRPGQLAPGGEDNQGGGARYPGTACPPGGKATVVGLPPGGQAVQGAR